MPMSRSSGCSWVRRYPSISVNSEKKALVRTVGPCAATKLRSWRTWRKNRRDWETMNGVPVSSVCATRLRASGRVSVTGFSPSTGMPACRALSVTGWWARGTVGLTIRSAPTSRARSTPSVPTPTTVGSGTPDCSITRCGAPSTRSATPASSATGLAAISRAHHDPIPPAPTTTTRAGRSAASAGKPLRWGAGVGAAAVSAVVAPPAGVGAAAVSAVVASPAGVRSVAVSAVVAPPAGVRSVARSDDTRGPFGVVGPEPVAPGIGDRHRGGGTVLRAGPGDSVGQHPLDLGLTVDGVLLVAGAEVEDLALAATEHGPGAEHLSPGVGGDEHQLVGGGDVEHLAVHLLLGHDDRMRDAAGDGVGPVDGPHPLLLAVIAPQQVAGGAHERLEGLGVVGRVQRDEAHALVDAAHHALADLVGDVAMGHVAPPAEHVGLGEGLLGQRLVDVVEQGDAHLGIDAVGREQAPQRLRDHGVHALGVDLLDLRVDLLVPVLTEHGDAQCHDSPSLPADHLRAAPSGRFAQS